MRQIVAELIRRDITPNSNNFADVVRSLCAGFGLRTATTRDYVQTLINAFKYLKWKPFVENNDYLTPEEKQAWLKKWNI